MLKSQMEQQSVSAILLNSCNNIWQVIVLFSSFLLKQFTDIKTSSIQLSEAVLNERIVVPWPSFRSGRIVCESWDGPARSWRRRRCWRRWQRRRRRHSYRDSRYRHPPRIPPSCAMRSQRVPLDCPSCTAGEEGRLYRDQHPQHHPRNTRDDKHARHHMHAMVSTVHSVHPRRGHRHKSERCRLKQLQVCSTMIFGSQAGFIIKIRLKELINHN